MFIFDKDPERVLQFKKREVLDDIEQAKARVLRELYALKRTAHGDACTLMADYNRMKPVLEGIEQDLIDIDNMKESLDDLRRETVIVSAKLTLVERNGS